MQNGETYEAFRARVQRETPDPECCAHGMALAHRCVRCEEERDARRADRRRDGLLFDADPTADRALGDCHYCGEPLVDRFAGQYGAREFWVRVHREPSSTDHAALTSADVWEPDEDDYR